MTEEKKLEAIKKLLDWVPKHLDAKELYNHKVATKSICISESEFETLGIGLRIELLEESMIHGKYEDPELGEN